MKTRIIITAAAMGWFSLAHAQEGTTAPVKDAAVTASPEAAGLKSAYHDCLLKAGKETFAILGLDENQVARITELQGRYKAGLQAAEEAKAPKGKQTKNAVAAKEPVAKESEQAVVATEPPSETAAPVDKTGVAVDAPIEEMREAELTDPLVMSTDDPAQTTVSSPETTIQTPGLDTPSDPAAGDALQDILTPEQWAQWHKKCYNAVSETGMIQP